MVSNQDGYSHGDASVRRDRILVGRDERLVLFSKILVPGVVLVFGSAVGGALWRDEWIWWDFVQSALGAIVFVLAIIPFGITVWSRLDPGRQHVEIERRLLGVPYSSQRFLFPNILRVVRQWDEESDLANNWASRSGIVPIALELPDGSHAVIHQTKSIQAASLVIEEWSAILKGALNGEEDGGRGQREKVPAES
jgi:hypothetical protein